VPLENTFRELAESLGRLRDHIAAVQVTAREDTPADGSVMAVEVLADAVDDALGWAEGSLGAALTAQKAVAAPANLQKARLQLVDCHRRFHCFQSRFFTDLLSFERLSELVSFTNRRDGEWRAWLASVRQGLDECAPSLDAASKALLDCWVELAERTGSPSVSVHNTLSRLVTRE
jgi:hypothetical protein